MATADSRQSDQAASLRDENTSEGLAHVSAPTISLPKGGGAIRGIGEKFGANPVTGTGSMSVPVPTSPSRSGLAPQLSLAYDSGSGNGPFGFGWTLSTPAITRKTEKDGLPRYTDDDQVESDVFLLLGAEDLVPIRDPDGSLFEDHTSAPGFAIRRYRPRIDTLFARIERWTELTTADTHWRSITRDNVTTLYGTTPESRIADPTTASPAYRTRVFSWLISETFDDKGNAIEYAYKPEDSTGVPATRSHEANRTPAQRSANRYLKRIRYGNTVPRLDPAQWPTNEWLFELVIDYGEHALLAPTPGDAGSWFCRNDPFSSYRPGFEVRSYRLCQRFLMFHHFPNEADVGQDCLVRSLDLRYRSNRGVASDTQLGAPVASFIASIESAGYRRDGAGSYIRRTLPPVEFTYSDATVSDSVETIDPASLENLPTGIDSTNYQWLDLFGEGVSGIFTEQANAWFYKPNLSPAADPYPTTTDRPVRFGALQQVGERPNVSMRAGGAQLLDLAGDGQPDVVTFDGPAAGFYELDEDAHWNPFRPFVSLPTISIEDPNLRFIDLDGDGHADLLVSEHEVLTWYPSLAKDGFAAAVTVPKPFDEEVGPAIAFADGTQSIYLADMTGDGLTDIVRIRNGEVCYWPNSGYGRFGAKVTMDDSPWFEAPDMFDQHRVRLADIDGSGSADIIYLDAGGVRLYFNQSGNSWSAAHRLSGFPPIDDLASVATVDLFGNGTACLVWSTPLTGEAGRQMRYVDLMGGQKPHLLLSVVNNLGAETRISYASSAKFYVRDKLAGTPWVTKLPFPVHTVERVNTLDRISGNSFVTRHAYHHGYFDGYEREFRGFGMVEQWDTEEIAALSDETKPTPTNLDAASNVPPVHTKTWFHTGVFLNRDRISNYFAGRSNSREPGEYYREPAWRTNDTEARKRLLEDTLLPDTVFRRDGTRNVHALTSDEEREACRALRGMMLRQETYGLDGTPAAEHPYAVKEQNFTVELLQPRGVNRHAVFFAHPRETIEYHYERHPDDPRVAHHLTLDTNPYGDVLRSASVAYGRRQPDPLITDPDDQAEQTRVHITSTENAFTHPLDDATTWRTPLPSQARTHELTGLSLGVSALRFTFDEIATAVGTATEISYEVSLSPATLQKRLIAHARTRYRPDDLGAAANDPLALLALGTVESMAVPGESYQLAFTPGLIGDIYGARVTNTMLSMEARYVHSEGDASWWIPSGRTFLSPSLADTAAQELMFARQHFFLPHRYRDPFHTTATPTETTVTYDRYDLLLSETQDALGNRMTVGERDASGTLIAAGNDYRVLQPRLMMDANRNRSAVTHDALGMIVGTAVMGKPVPATVEGDSLTSFDTDLTETVVLAHLAAPLTDPTAVLQHASTRLIYDLFAYQRSKADTQPQPAVVYTIARETHDSEPLPAGGVKTQHSFSYSDGFGREIQKKVQAEPGLGPERDATGKIMVGADGRAVVTPTPVSPRWVGSGWTVFNNKGKPVRQFEPFFTDTHHFDSDVRIGVSPVLFYDPAGRTVATLQPNHTWSKAVFGPWRQETWDANDTVLVADPASDPDVGDFFTRLPTADYLPTWRAQRASGALGPDEQDAARRAAIHAATPTIVHADSLGRAFLTIAHNRFKYSNASAAGPPTEEHHRTRMIFDIAGNQRAVIDPKGRVVVRYDYDMHGNHIHQASMEAGARWMLNDTVGKQIFAWDSRDHRFRSAYDALRRPTDALLQEGAAAELPVGRTVYGETRPDAEANNLRGKVIQLYDQAGVATSDAYDFKGNPLRSRRQLAQAYSTTLDWSAAVPLDAPIYTSRTRYDALNRPIQQIAPHSDQPGATVNITQPVYNEGNLLDQVHAWLNETAEPAGMLAPTTASTHAVTNIDYDAKGQRTAIDFGNGARTTYAYDPRTFRLVNLLTRRAADVLQDLRYTYDPVGNITHIRDDAQQTSFFSNQIVQPNADYTYDALYRLIEATGREHLGQAGTPSPPSYNDASRVGISFAAADGNAMGRYLERYVYDAAGNFEALEHTGSNPTNPGWTSTYTYDETSLLEAGNHSNRLTSTATGPTNASTYSTGGDGYDPHGNMLRMPHLQEMRWDFKDQLSMTRRQAVNASDAEGAQHQGERTWYVYDATGQRVRKVTERATGGVKDERTYLGGFEVFRKAGANPVVRETLHIMDDKRRIALVDTRTAGTETGVPKQVIRYQFGNHLESASLELDDQARIISYEEYTPYGSTSYQAVRSQTGTPKRYRYTGKERDDGSGLYYHGARYYAPWLGRWTSCDPAGLIDGTNVFAYVRGNPVRFADPSGTQQVLHKLDPSAEKPAQTADRPWWQTAIESAELVSKAVTAPTWIGPAAAVAVLGAANEALSDAGIHLEALPFGPLEAQAFELAELGLAVKFGVLKPGVVKALEALAADERGAVKIPFTGVKATGTAPSTIGVSGRPVGPVAASRALAPENQVASGLRSGSSPSLAPKVLTVEEEAAGPQGMAERGEQLFNQLGEKMIKDQDPLSNPNAVGQLRSMLTVSLVEPTGWGGMRIASTQNAQAYDLLQSGSIKLLPNEVLGSKPMVLKAGEAWLLPPGNVHAEILGVWDATARGAEGGTVFTTNKACAGICNPLFEGLPNWTHLNPQR